MNALMTIEEVAEYFQTSKYTIYRLLRRKEIPASKIGNQWRFKREALDEWLKTNSVTTERPAHETRAVEPLSDKAL